MRVAAGQHAEPSLGAPSTRDTDHDPTEERVLRYLRNLLGNDASGEGEQLPSVLRQP